MKDPKDYTDEDQRALRDLETAGNALKRAAGGKTGEGAENLYGQAYNKVYRMGLRDFPAQICRTTR